MNTEIKKEEGLIEAAELIKKGEIVGMPTETVYGLAGDAFNLLAIDKIYEAKGRPKDNPLIVHISKIDDIYKVCDDPPLIFFDLAKRFWPGPLTMIVKKSAAVPMRITAGLDSVAVRMPSHSMAKKFIELSDTLIAAPSANLSKHVSPTTAMHVYNDLKGRIPLILDGGTCDVGIESTVLSLVTEVPTILRPGGITEEMLLEVLGEVKTHAGKVIAAAPAPGMKYKHYAPKCPAVLSSDEKQTLDLYAKYENQGKIPVILTETQHIAVYLDKNVIDMGVDGRAVAHNLYGALRRAEESYDVIIVDRLSDTGMDKSVMNRITKATADEK